MVFPLDDENQDIPILRLKIEAWEWYGDNGFFWYHEFSVGKGSADVWHTNCFLYPGETGLFSVSTPGCQLYPENCISETTFIDKPPEAIGMQLVGYQDLKTYIPWPDLYPGYHLKVENPSFSVEDYRIIFGFDLPKSVFNPNYTFMTRVVVYDENGKMLGILSKSNIAELFIDNGGDTYHISGYHAPKPDQGADGKNYFRGDLLDEDYDRIDHIRVVVEKQHLFLCYYNGYNGYRDYIAEHPEESGA
jgi:hypothetical protein